MEEGIKKIKGKPRLLRAGAARVGLCVVAFTGGSGESGGDSCLNHECDDKEKGAIGVDSANEESSGDDGDK